MRYATIYGAFTNIYKLCKVGDQPNSSQHRLLLHCRAMRDTSIQRLAKRKKIHIYVAVIPGQ